MSKTIKLRNRRYVPPTEIRNGWEIFHDMCTWDLISVRPVGNRTYGDAVHFVTWQDARDYADKEPAPLHELNTTREQDRNR